LFKLLSMVTDWTWFNLGDDFTVWPHPNNGKNAFIEKFGLYGWVFWIWILITAVSLFFLIKFCASKHDKNIDKKVVLIYGIIMFVTEVYKEIFFSIKCGHYDWDYIPWQFCSTPMWCCLVAPLLKEGKVQDALYKFLGIFALLAATVSIALPEGFYWNYITITQHSYLWHTSMFVVGVYLTVAKGYGKDIKSFFKEMLPGFIVFVSFVLVAIIINEVGWACITSKHAQVGNLNGKIVVDYSDYWINSFYMSRQLGSTLPIMSDLIKVMSDPWPLYIAFVLLYCVAFFVGTSVIWFASFGIRKLIAFVKTKFPKKA